MAANSVRCLRDGGESVKGGPPQGPPPWVPPPDPCTGALLAERRTVVVPARVTRAEQAAFGPAEALRLPNAGELANEVVSGLGERWLDAFVRIEDHAAAGDIAGRRLHLPQASSKPSRRDQSRRRRVLGATPDMSIRACISPHFGAVDRSIGGGPLPARLSAQKPRVRFGSMRANRSGANGF